MNRREYYAFIREVKKAEETGELSGTEAEDLRNQAYWEIEIEYAPPSHYGPAPPIGGWDQNEGAKGF